MPIIARDEDVTVGGLRLRMHIYGPATGSPVVMLHGGALMGSTWRRVCERLPAYRCFAPDMRGHGDSDWGPAHEYRLDAFAADLRAVIGSYALDRPHLVGMSLGGQSALHAVCHGLRVRSLCLVDVGPFLRREGGRTINAFVDQVEFPTFEAAVDAAARFNPRRDREGLVASLRRSMRETRSGAWTWKWDPARLPTRGARADEAEALWPLLGNVRCPSLVVRGGESPIFTAELADRFVAALPDGRGACVPEAGHTVQSDQPERLAALLAAFWADVDRDAP